MKTFLFDLTKCTGCYSCQIGCKDEHCGNCWMPYAQEQPDTGQFWMHVREKEQGHRPFVIVDYVPTPCQQCEDAPCMKVAQNGAVYRREDGIVIIDPEKAKGQRKIAEVCPYRAVYYNEELDIPQKCTGCAHILDGKVPTIDVPRCYDNCVHDAIIWGEESELDLEGAEKLNPEFGTKPRIWYKGLPKPFIAGTVYDPVEKEIIEGAKVTAKSDAGEYTVVTDDFGDFWLNDLPKADWTLTIAVGGKSMTMEASTKYGAKGLGDIAFA